MLCYTLVISLIDVAHVYQRVAHLVLSAIDEGIDHLIDSLVTHHVYMDRQTLGISLACQFCHLCFRPVGNALVTVGIEWIHNSCSSLYPSVEEELDPFRYDARGFEFLGVNGSGECLVHVHPAFNLVGQCQYEVQLASLVQLLGGLIVVGVDKIVAPALAVHCVTH